MPPPVPPSRPSSSAKRTNWWLIGGGGCLGLILLGLIVGGAMCLVSLKMIETADAYKVAMYFATHSPEVREALGTPIKPGWQVRGNVDSETTNGITSRTADLTIPLTGPKASGSLHFSGVKIGERWYTRDFSVTVNGSHQKIPVRVSETAGNF